uniref:Uncharacterized protein n=1 Tax=Sus scrofa TaxID=9823 RepID=A0A4X1TC98_PIG
MEEYSRALPRGIVADCGGAFTMGTIGGGIFQAIKGFRSSPEKIIRVLIFNILRLFSL